MKLLVATGNPGKLREYQEILSDLPFDIEWVSLRDVALEGLHVEENGHTFAENASIKARAYARASGLLTLADDSGLVVDALDGAPGIYSARYGAPDITTDRGRYEKLLKELETIPDEQRTARFVCAIALVVDTSLQTVRGTLEGYIAHAPRGTNGFGYDPVFLLPDGRTLAELPSHEKHRISHRGNALVAARPILQQILENQGR